MGALGEDSTWTRRRLLHAGVVASSGLTLANLLRSESQVRAVGGSPAGQRSCILIILSGGPGQHDTFDPKPLAPQEIRGQYSAIATRTPGMHVSEMFPRLANVSEKYCLVRSMSHGDAVHVSAAHTMLTGQPNGAPADNSPFIGSLVSRFAPSTAAVPSYVWLHNMKTGTNKIPRYNSGLNILGQQYAPLRIGHELDNPSAPGFRVNSFDPPEGLSEVQLQSRRALQSTIDRQLHAPTGLEANRFDRFQEKAWDMLTTTAARDAFDVALEPAEVRERYGLHPPGQYCLMARRLIEAGVRLVTLTAWPGLAPGETQPTVTQVWDMHDEYYKPGDNMYGNGPYGAKWSFPRLDQAVATLLTDLDERGLLEDTLVAMVGEFGRTPLFEGRGLGRGHWPHCYTALFAGAGVQRGSVFGSSDKQGAFVASGRPVSQADFGATIFSALGIPPETRYGADAFSLRVSPGEPLHEIFA